MKPIDWKKLCRAEGIAVEDEAVRVDLPGGRSHRVAVRDEGDTLELSAVVARARALSSVERAPLAAFRRNRTAQLAGFRIDARGRMVGEAWVPKHGLTSGELALHLRSVAAECDRLEYRNPLYDQRSHAPLKPAGCHGWRAAPRMGGDARDRARCSARAGGSA